MMELPLKVKAALKKIPPFKKVVVGVSGGMDSVVLAHVLKHLGYEVIIAHLNHGLRGEASDKDEKFVIELAKAWDLPYVTKKAVIPTKGNLEHNARNIRYSFLDEVRLAYHAEVMAVGHHFDDQIETILLHERRGAGLRGRRGMRLMNDKLIRPLLDIPRRDVEAYANAHLLDYVIDETNMDMSFSRNYLRHEVIPKLKEDPLFEARMRQTAKEAAEKVEVLQEARDEWLEAHFKEGYLDRRAFNALDKDLRAEILLELVGQQDVYCSTIQRLTEFIEKGKTGKKLEVKGVSFEIEYETIRVHSQKQELEVGPVKLQDYLQWGEYEIIVKDLKVLKVRSWREGDRFQPAGMQGTKKLQDFFVDQKIPQSRRKSIPIVVDEQDQIVCVGDLRFSEPFKEWKDKLEVKQRKADS